MNNADFRPFQVCHFKIVTIHIAITTADWGRLYKLLYVVLDASSYLLPGDYIAVKMLIHIYWSCHLGIGPSLHMGSLPVRKPIINTLTCTSKLMCTYINVALTYTNFQCAHSVVREGYFIKQRDIKGTKCLWPLLPWWPVLLTLSLPLLHNIGHHDNTLGMLLPHQPPKVYYSLLIWTCMYET